MLSLYTHVCVPNVYMLYQLQRNLDDEEALVDVAVVTPGLVASEIGNPVRGARSGIPYCCIECVLSRTCSSRMCSL